MDSDHWPKVHGAVQVALSHLLAKPGYLVLRAGGTPWVDYYCFFRPLPRPPEESGNLAIVSGIVQRMELTEPRGRSSNGKRLRRLSRPWTDFRRHKDTVNSMKANRTYPVTRKTRCRQSELYQRSQHRSDRVSPLQGLLRRRVQPDLNLNK